MRSLLDASAFPQIPAYVGSIFAVTLLDWAVGGMLGGVLSDYIGRKRTMILAIIAYSVMTGLTAFAFNWLSFTVLRFLVGIAIGSEWVTGASLVAELWPDRARQGRRPDAERNLHRILLRVVDVAVCWSAGSRCLALYVPDRRRSGNSDVVDQDFDPRTRALAQRRRPASRGPPAEAQRRGAHRRRPGAYPLYHD